MKSTGGLFFSVFALLLAACSGASAPSAPTSTAVAIPTATSIPSPTTAASATALPIVTVAPTATVLLTATTVPPLAFASVKDSADKLVLPFMQKNGVPGVSVIVVLPDPSAPSKLTFTILSYGIASKKNNKPIDQTTIFEMGSETKVFTALVLSSLVKEGKMGFSDPIGKYLPATVKPPTFNGKGITLLDLATHRSGLPDSATNLTNDRGDYTIELMYSFLSSYTLTRAPGASYEYSNAGFALLGDLESNATNIAYGDLVAQKVTTPLKMSDTRLLLSDEQKQRFAQGYQMNGNEAPPWNNYRAYAGGGGLYTTPQDMAKFLIANLEADPTTPLGAALLDAQTIRPNQTNPNDQRIGLAWDMLNAPRISTQPLIWKNGGTTGFNTFMALVKEKRIATEVMVNKNNSDTSTLALDILRALTQ